MPWVLLTLATSVVATILIWWLWRAVATRPSGLRLQALASVLTLGALALAAITALAVLESSTVRDLFLTVGFHGATRWLPLLVLLELARRKRGGAPLDIPLLSVSVALFVMGIYTGPPDRAARPVPRVILITVDTLRRDALSWYGGTVSTPNIDALAEHSVVFQNAYSNGPWTLPAVASIMTGLSPWVHQSKHTFDAFPETVPTLAEYLADAGYRTKSIGYNPFLATPPGPSEGMQRGFMDESGFFPRPADVDWKTAPFEEASQGLTTDDIVSLAEEWIDQNQSSDFFLWIHIFDPHPPYDPPEEFIASVPETQDSDRRLYEAEVAFVDDRIGRLFTQLKELDIYDDTLIVFTSDHGEEIGDHSDSGHGHTLYDELLAVPLILKLPEPSVARAVEERVSTDCVMPTVLDLLNIPYEEDLLTGSSLAPHWETSLSDRKVFSTGIEWHKEREAVIFNEFKYIQFVGTSRRELYDLALDPGEHKNIARDFPQLVEVGRLLLDEHRAKAEALRKTYGMKHVETRTLDEESIRLKFLSAGRRFPVLFQ